LKLDGISRLPPRPDVASAGFASDFVSIHDKAAAELFRKLSKTDLIALFNEDLAALVSARRPGPVQIEGPRLRRYEKTGANQYDAQSSRSAQIEQGHL
jgi:hypothetical protein